MKSFSLLRQRMLLLAGGHVILTGLCFGSFCLWFGYGPGLLAPHMLLTGSAYSAVMAVVMILRRFLGPGWPADRAAVFLLTAVSSFLLLVYIVNFLSNWAWKANMTFHFAGDVLSDLIRHQPLDAFLVGLLVFLTVFGTWRVYRFIWPRVGIGQDAGGGWRTALLAFVAISGYTAWDYNRVHSVFPDRLNPYSGEVITDMLTPYIDTSRQEAPPPPPETAAGAPLTDGGQNVIFIIADSMRADRTSAYGYYRDTTPFLRELVESGKAMAVRHAQAMCAQSHCSLIGLLSSRTYKNQAPGKKNLQAVLRSAGYRIVFIASGNQYFSGRSVNHYPPYDLFVDGITEPRDYAVNDDRMVLSRLSDYPAAGPQTQPHFFFIYLMASHVLGTRPPGFAEYLPQSIYVPATPLFFWSRIHAFFRDALYGTLPERSVDQMYRNFYDNGVHYADFVTRRVFEILQDKGYLDDAQVWFLADHGESLGKDGKWGHQLGLGQDQFHIPMIVMDTRRRDYKERLFATQVDVPVTILSGLGIGVPADWEGQSLLEPSVTRVSPHRLPTHWDDYVNFLYQADQEKVYKYIKPHRHEPAELYEITADPGEERDLVADEAGRRLIREYRLDLDRASRKGG